MKSHVKLMVISGNKQMTQFMQCADVFEKSKVIGTARIITVSYKENEKVNLKRAAILIDATKKALESEEIVSFIHVLEITNGNVTITNQGEILPYINKDIRCVSDGKNWFVLSDFLRQKTNLKIITNEHKFITSIGINTDGFNHVKFKVEKKINK